MKVSWYVLKSEKYAFKKFWNHLPSFSGPFFLSYFGTAEAILRSKVGHSNSFFESIERYTAKPKFNIRKILKINHNPKNLIFMPF